MICPCFTPSPTSDSLRHPSVFLAHLPQPCCILLDLHIYIFCPFYLELTLPFHLVNSDSSLRSQLYCHSPREALPDPPNHLIITPSLKLVGVVIVQIPFLLISMWVQRPCLVLPIIVSPASDSREHLVGFNRNLTESILFLSNHMVHL